MQYYKKKVLDYIISILGNIIVLLLVILFQFTPIVSYSQNLVPFLKKNGNYIYVDSISFKPVIKQEFTKASEFQPCGNAIVIKNNKWGIINKLGIEVTPCKYDIIENYVSGLARVGYKTNDTTYAYKSIIYNGKEYQTIDSSKRYIDERYNFGYVNQSGIEVIPTIYRNLVQLNDSIFHCQVDFKVGLINNKNEFILPAIYKDAFTLNNGFIVIVDQSWKKALSNKTGNLITNFKYDEIENFQNGLAKVVIGEDYNTQKMGWIDLTGKEIIPVIYSVKGTLTFSNEYLFYNEIKSEFGLSTSGEYKNVGYIDKSKDQITELSLGNYLFMNYKNGYFFAYNRLNSEVLIMNKLGKVLTKQNNNYSIDYGDSRFEYSDTDSSSFIKISSHNKYKPLTAKKIDGQYYSYGIIDFISNTIIVPPVYHGINKFHDGIANVYYSVKDNNLHPNGIHGGVDIYGKQVIPMMYDKMSYFKNGLAFVRLQGKCGMINKKNKIIIPIIYDDIEEFINAYAEIYSLGTIIDKTNDPYRRILKSQPELSFGLIKVFLKGKIGFLNINGTVAIAAKYNYATLQKSGMILAMSSKVFNGKNYFYIDKGGREYIEH